ncbi:MAG TPA: GNAT family N-acetyltransferase [Atribacteraceae bacterium]|nr:GNAT family N-acetyltransferase [Atribacteraceae bacterium]
MIQNDILILRPVSFNDQQFVIHIRNNPTIYRELFSDPPLYDFVHERWLRNVNSDETIDLIIEYQGTRAGRICLNYISYRHMRAEYGIVLLPEYQSKGLAYQASCLLFDYVFQNLPLQKIYLKVFADNQTAIALYKKLGFQEEGRLLKEYYKNGKWRDVLRMATFKDDWLARKA